MLIRNQVADKTNVTVDHKSITNNHRLIHIPKQNSTIYRPELSDHIQRYHYLLGQASLWAMRYFAVPTGTSWVFEAILKGPEGQFFCRPPGNVVTSHLAAF